MNLTLPEKERVSKKRVMIYISTLAVCVLAIIIVIGIQILGNDVVDNLFGIKQIIKRSEQEEVELKANFEKIFDNGLDDKGNYNTQKNDKNKEIVYTYYQKEEKNENYEVNVNLPYINIKNSTIQNFNKEIADTFQKKAEEIISEEENTIYSVKYKAIIENNILSVVLYADLKQNTSAQRVIVETFNFNLDENKKIELEDILKIYKLNENDIQDKIEKDIKEEQRKADELKKIGYNVFSRDVESESYKIENIKEYFIYNNNIYIVFAYGNEQITSEMDIVII